MGKAEPAFIWILIAFEKPPKSTGMRQATNGKSFWRRFTSREAVLPVRDILRRNNIRYICKKQPADQPQIPRGQPARAVRDLKEAHELAAKYYQAGRIEGLKQARYKAEADKRKAELERQAVRRAQTEALRRADAVAQTAGDPGKPKPQMRGFRSGGKPFIGQHFN